LTFIENLLPKKFQVKATDGEFASEGVSDYKEKHTNTAAVFSDVILRQRMDGWFLL